MGESEHPAMVRSMVLDSARKRFFERGELPDEGLNDVILRSWERCRSNGLPANHAESAAHADRAKLSESRERSAELLHQASGLMEHVFEQIRATGSMVILADVEGMIIHSLGDPDFVDRANRVALQPGASWHECARGTNAIGTALAERAAVEVFGKEHFYDRNGFLTCTAAPVFDASGQVAGVLDISSDYRNHQRHTLGLVRLSVQLLEKRLFEARFAGQTIVAFHLRPEYLGSLQEGLIAIDESGCVLGANQIAREWLNAVSCGAQGISFGTLFRGRFGSFLERATPASTSVHGIHKLELRDGGALHLQLRGVRHVAGVKSVETKPTKPASLVPAPDDGPCARSGGNVTLECLDTGDERLHLALERARRVAGKDIPLLIQGESGVGKELFAQAFHNSGPRARGAFVALNCAAIPENLIESELFGYVGGAFTGARREGAIGKIQQASGGTLFLDEIGDMPLGMQARLLRVLQERSVTPIGSLKSIPVDISLVCATHRNLRESVARGAFREDLYYRVNGLTVTLPALRQRSDIRGLVRNVLAVENCESGTGDIEIGEEVMRFFEQYPWPGNIRQLQNVIRVALALLDANERVIRAVHLPEELFAEDAVSCAEELDGECAEAPVLRSRARVPMPGRSLPESAAGGVPAAGRSLDEIELEAIAVVMRETGGNVSAAARRLGVSRNTLYRKLGRMK